MPKTDARSTASAISRTAATSRGESLTSVRSTAIPRSAMAPHGINCSVDDADRTAGSPLGRDPVLWATLPRIGQNVLMTDQSQAEHGPQPFAHMSAPNATLYRAVLRAFARAKERFIVHLRPEDVAAELRRESDEQLAQALEKLVEWGNLRADAD